MPAGPTRRKARIWREDMMMIPNAVYRKPGHLWKYYDGETYAEAITFNHLITWLKENFDASRTNAHPHRT